MDLWALKCCCATAGRRLAPQCTTVQAGGGNCPREIISPGEMAGGEFATLGIPKAPNCLTHTLTCKPMLCSEADRFANQMATESSTTSQHLKESAVPNTCPNSTETNANCHVRQTMWAPTMKPLNSTCVKFRKLP